MNIRHTIRRILKEDDRVYDYDETRNTIPYEDRLPFDVDKLISVGAVFVTPAIDGDPSSKTYKEWLKEPYVHLITLKNILDAKPDSWIYNAITKTANPEPYRNDLVKKIYDGKYNQILWSLEELGVDPNEMLIDKNNLQETIRRILKEETYSPAGDEYFPNRFVIHKSNPIWRENILETGLQASVGDCYKTYSQNFSEEECEPAIFATDSENENYWFDSSWDDDVWLINTDCAEVTWYKDKHYRGGDYEYHILTFENIPSKCIKLIYEGTGESY